MSENSQATTQALVHLSEKAHQKALEFVDTGIADAIRMGVRGGGCSGFTYQLALDHPHDGDIVWEQDGVTLALAPDSVPYLQGSTLNWKDNLMEGGFEFENPNAISSCGCGSSFVIREGDGCESAL
jgi:iron-sulfur cluster assembly protein